MPMAHPLKLASVAAVMLAACASPPMKEPMSFFVTSAGPGDGGNLGGLQGADAHCQKLAAAAGAGNKTWRAYLSPATYHPARPPFTPAIASARGPGPMPKAC